jgi:hypothetical protein
MICSQCGNDVVEGAVCPRCGTQLNLNEGAEVRFGAAAGPPARVPMGHAATAVRPTFNLDLRRLTRNDQIVGGATLVLFISLFLPWFTVSVKGFGSGSVNGLYHAYMYIDLILALAILAFLIVRAGFDELPFRLPVGPEQALLAATGLNFLLALISFVFKPASDFGISVGWGIGAFIGLIAAIAAVAPLGAPFLQSRAGR